MCYFVLTNNGRVVSRTTVQHITCTELDSVPIKTLLHSFDANIKETLNDSNHILPQSDKVFYLDDVQPNEADAVEEDVDVVDNYFNEAFDEYLNAEVYLPFQGEIIKRQKGKDGNPIGIRNENPLKSSRKYLVGFGDGLEVEYDANTIAENLYSQCDLEGKQHLVFVAIVYHRKTARHVK
jgi:hypothetical protein